MDPYVIGYRARIAGKPSSVNPFLPNNWKHRAWDDGWHHFENRRVIG